ncbi:MAG: CRISPR-associated endonuclease Cas3'' [Verrucomicrobia bacterium]|nr:CRISPR-associated endonuclease Cas3'' [Verrucomicrobiota bacterium]
MAFFAHTRPNCEQSEWHELGDHLERTSELAERFCSTFAPGWGKVAGLWHDLGKYQSKFQRKLELSNSEGYEDKSGGTGLKVEHAIVGALLAHQLLEGEGKELANCIASHHGGLKEALHLRQRLESGEVVPALEECKRNLDNASIMPKDLPVRPEWVKSDSIQAAMWTRFLFSALTDADSLQTEAWSEGKDRQRIEYPLGELDERLTAYLNTFQQPENRSPVYMMRQGVLKSCLEAAEWAAGDFSLTVPTGGGKTYSALAFALKHAVKYGLQRVIVVLPFRTVLEQTVGEYEKALGPGVVIQHHSNVDPTGESLVERQATENWDAPIIVTTSVQFLESLYADRKSRCRKLHNITSSVVILDEVQTFPLDLMDPIKSALGLLTTRFGTSVVYCTATQPMLAHGEDIREIIPDTVRLFESVRGRFQTHWKLTSSGGKPDPWDMARLANELVSEQDSVLAIVHRRNEAAELAKFWGDDVLHLSARMAPMHRSAVVAEIKSRLKQKQIVRVAATQLVEAGVDLDFPVVYRAMAGLDSLAQSAGRCNRVGNLALGRFVVFLAATKPPGKPLQQAMELAQEFESMGDSDLSQPDLYRRFFGLLKRESSSAKHDLMTLERERNFPEVSLRFQMIEDHGESVIAPYTLSGEKEPACEPVLRQLHFGGPSREVLRTLQRFVVTLYNHEILQLQKDGYIEPANPKLEKFWRVKPGSESLVYDKRLGFLPSPELGGGVFVD